MLSIADLFPPLGTPITPSLDLEALLAWLDSLGLFILFEMINRTIIHVCQRPLLNLTNFRSIPICSNYM